MSSRSIDPKDVRRLRVINRTKHEFLIEHNVIEEGYHPSREEIKRLYGKLVYSERQALESRINERLERLDDLMDGEIKRFDEPAVEHGDLVSGVRIPDFHD